MASKQNTIAARLSDELYARFNACIAAEVAARPRVDKLDEYSQGMALREAAKCWRILDAVAKRLCRIVKTSVTKQGASLR